jgi:hypothetical protein
MVSGFPGGAQRGHKSIAGCIAEWQVHCRLGVHPHPADPRAAIIADSSPPPPWSPPHENISPVSDALETISSVTTESWAEVPANSRFFAIWRGGVVYSDR